MPNCAICSDVVSNRPQSILMIDRLAISAIQFGYEMHEFTMR